MRQILVAVGLVPPWLIPEPGMTTELLLVLGTSSSRTASQNYLGQGLSRSRPMTLGRRQAKQLLEWLVLAVHMYYDESQGLEWLPGCYPDLTGGALKFGRKPLASYSPENKPSPYNETLAAWQSYPEL